VQDSAGTLGFMVQELRDSAQELWDLTAAREVRHDRRTETEGDAD